MWITAQASARVERLASEAGAQKVEANEVLLELSNPDLQIQTMQAEQQVRQAEIDLLNLKTNLRSGILTQEGLVASDAHADGSVPSRRRARGFAGQTGTHCRHSMPPIARRSAEEMTTRYRIEQERLELMKAAIDSQIAVQAAQVVQLDAIAANQRARLRSLSVKAV